MTSITFRMEGDRIIGFDSRGHSGYAEEGADIVCAGITSAIRLAEATINDVLGLAASVKVRESDASISLRPVSYTHLTAFHHYRQRRGFGIRNRVQQICGVHQK